MKTLKLWALALLLLASLVLDAPAAVGTYVGDEIRTNNVVSTNLVRVVVQEIGTAGTGANGLVRLIPVACLFSNRVVYGALTFSGTNAQLVIPTFADYASWTNAGGAVDGGLMFNADTSEYYGIAGGVPFVFVGNALQNTFSGLNTFQTNVLFTGVGTNVVAGVASFRNGATAHGGIRIYQGYTGETDYSRMNFTTETNDFKLTLQKAGSYAATSYRFLIAGNANIGFTNCLYGDLVNGRWGINKVPTTALDVNGGIISSSLTVTYDVICRNTTLSGLLSTSSGAAAYAPPLQIGGLVNGASFLGTNTMGVSLGALNSSHMLINATNNSYKLVAGNDLNASNVFFGVTLGGQIFSSPTNYTTALTTNWTVNWQSSMQQRLVITNALCTNGVFLYSANHAAAYALAANGAETDVRMRVYNSCLSPVPVSFTNAWHWYSTIPTNIPVGKWLTLDLSLIAGTADESGIHVIAQPEN